MEPVAAPSVAGRAARRVSLRTERQRVVGAIANWCQPKIIIADKPRTSLDVTAQAQYLRLLREVQDKTGMAILFFTHDFGIVANLCHRILVMYLGRIAEFGPVDKILARPAHPYTGRCSRPRCRPIPVPCATRSS